ncbi:hypothetical protein G7Y89_g1529 [Cudoniella acicularis]|uniref:Heterokaryon incompatibility domain-containing protein n=1 Tax=Cudoniella acicularis TaxID=354080 RepID=A0A8H4RV32_9HELO|nr:hypothetical protein G7Y89_g1529 [Cudoniella acicularis]
MQERGTWLGEATEDSNEAMDFIKELEQIFVNTPNFLRPQNTIFRLLERTNEWRTFRRLVERPWFSRIWVVQEVALASKASILCDGEQMDWHRFARVMEELDRQSLGALLLPQDGVGVLQTTVMPIGWPSIRKIQAARNTTTRKELLSLEKTINLFVGFNATDPRDKVFAILGIVEDRDDEAWQPDYRKPVEKLYEEVTENMMWKEESLGLLSSAGIGGNRAIEGLPSWVPDYYVTTGAVPFRGGAAGGQSSLCSFSFHLSLQGPKELHVRGRVLSPLLELGPLHEVSRVSTTGTKRTDFFTWYLDTAKIFCKPEAETQFWRALVANQFRAPENIDPYPDEDWFLSCFESFKDIFQQVYNSTLPAMEQLYNAREVGKAQAFRNPMIVGTLGRRMCRTELDFGNKSEGRLGLVPRGAEAGDLVCVINGVNVPFIVRRMGLHENAGNEEYKVVGECYIHGLAEGEA